MKKSVIIKIIILLGVLFLGIVIGSFYEHGALTDQFKILKPVRETDTNYKFIRPLLFYNLPDSGNQEGFSQLENKIRDLIAQKKSNKQATEVSLYFQALNEGRWIGIDEDKTYDPASLLKTILLVVYYEKAEQDMTLLDRELPYTKAVDEFIKKEQYVVPTELVIGQSYQIEYLIEKMIIDSDNGAWMLLWVNMDKDSVNMVTDTLGLPRIYETENFTISPKAYSLLFRTLYSATYLNRAMSERALAVLAKAKFNEGLTVGLPSDVVIAHKFGYNMVSDNGQPGEAELHDCGIIYYVPSPYFVCIMTRGSNFDDLKNVIQDISKLIYDEIPQILNKK